MQLSKGGLARGAGATSSLRRDGCISPQSAHARTSPSSLLARARASEKSKPGSVALRGTLTPRQWDPGQHGAGGGFPARLQQAS